eukprot:CAMPEP_0197052562 /NCGR_PEP_ID=MMETSP1384-20130603/27022_1 /TAXON_ID=29189 /ORGANISM="Ammonia sp." /LENGTH=918 /DNA_ID=CAMNT_0042485323 /DNA_START=24 /DNA_END=2780 /DNA_ORIENTATION=-
MAQDLEAKADANQDKVFKDTLVKHGLSATAEKLVEKGFNLKYLSACTEQNVEDLCNDLEITDLLNQLKFKACLQEFDIPKADQIRYSVVSEKEQNCLNEIASNLQSLQTVVDSFLTNSDKTTSQKNVKRVSAGINAKTIKQNKQLINCTFDSLIQMLNDKRQEILMELEQSYTHSQEQTNAVLECYHELKQIHAKCTQLVAPRKAGNDESTYSKDTRYNFMCSVLNEWKKKHKDLQQTKKINISIRDTQQFAQVIADIVRISPQRMNVMQEVEKMDEQSNQQTNKPKRSSINGLPYDEHAIDSIQLEQATPVQPEDVAIRAAEQNTDDIDNKPFGFSFGESYHDEPISFDSGFGAGFSNVGWDFAWDQPANMLNGDDAPKEASQDAARNEGDNGVEITFKPLCRLEEQRVSTGHEEERLLQSIKFKVLYVFGQDVSGEWCWKQRAKYSSIHFYQSTHDNKIRVVAREHVTNKLRLNHYVPRNEAICGFRLKTENVYTWNAADDTVVGREDALCSFCVKFETSTQTRAFAEQFKAAMTNNQQPKRQPIKAKISRVDELNDDDSKEPERDRNDADAKAGGFKFAKSHAEGTGLEPFKFSADANDAGNKSASFVDDKQVNYGDYMQNIKQFIHTDDVEEESTEQRVEDPECITFEPIVTLPEVEVATGHEMEVKLREFPISRIYRWGKDVTDSACWKIRASKTTLVFYQHKETKAIRLVCREEITNKLRLNQYVNNDIADIAKKAEKQVQWVAVDATIAVEEQQAAVGNDGCCLFAAKFLDDESADSFMRFYRTGGNGSLQRERVDKSGDNNCVQLDEYDILEFEARAHDEWVALAKDAKLRLLQNGADGKMMIKCKGASHVIPHPDVVDARKKPPNAMEWCSESGRVFRATFQDDQSRDAFHDFFMDGARNNAQSQTLYE